MKPVKKVLVQVAGEGEYEMRSFLELTHFAGILALMIFAFNCVSS